MATQLTYDQVELAKEDVRDKLSAAITRRRQLLWAAQQPGATDADRRAAQVAGDAVGRLESQLDALDYGSAEISAAEQERRTAERAANARREAVEMIALINEHFWKIEQVDEALVAAANRMKEAEGIAGRIQLGVGVFGGDLQGNSAANSFLADLGISSFADIPNAFSKEVRVSGYARTLVYSRASAIRALGRVLPDVLDEAVQEEGAALARARHSGEDEPNVGGNDD